MALEGVAAAAVSNQTRGLVDALLGPQIEKIRKWSLDKELRSKLKPEKLSEVFDRHLRETLATCSTVQSIVFPQQALSLAEIYEPLALEVIGVEARKRKSETVLPSNLITSIRHSTIIDHAGMGKTTFSKYLIRRACEITDRIPILINLQRYEGVEPLVDLLFRQIKELLREVGEIGFEQLLTSGKFFVVLDGFDEVTSSWQSDVRRKIEEFSVKCGGSRVVLTTRPQNNIPILTGGIQYRFRRFNMTQTEALLRRYDKVAGINVGERLIKELPSVPQELLQTPLLTALLYRTFGANNAISEHISAFYSDTYEALFRGHDLTKAGYVRQKASGLNIDDFRRILQRICFCAIAARRTSWSSEDELHEFIKSTDIEPDTIRPICSDLLTAVPFLVADGTEIRFIHRTFAEYFAAEFVARHPDSVRLLEALRDSFHWKEISVVLKFINEIGPEVSKRVFDVPAARTVLGKKSDGQMTQEETLSECFDWYLLWGVGSQIGDIESKLRESKLQGCKAKLRQYVRNHRVLSCWLAGIPAKDFTPLPSFTWQNLTEVDAAAVSAVKRRLTPERESALIEEERASTKLFVDALTQLEPSVFVEMDNSLAARAMASPGVLEAFLEIVAELMDYDEGAPPRVITADRSRDIIATNERSVEEATKFENLLTTSSIKKPNINS